MPRDKFISDNLINIRDHLRQNYEDRNHSAQEESQDKREIHLDLKTPVSQPSGNLRSSDREFNEFAGRLQHDLAAVQNEIETQKKKTELLIYFDEKLQNIAGDLQKLNVENSQAFFREFDHLKIIYYQEAGRAAAARSRSSASIQQPAEQVPVKSKRDLLLPAAILIAALMISLTLLAVFG